MKTIPGNRERFLYLNMKINNEADNNEANNNLNMYGFHQREDNFETDLL